MRSLGFAVALRLVAWCGLLGGLAGAFAPRPALAGQTWLFVNDIHLNPRSHNRRPITRAGDTNEALLDSALAEMKRRAPDPPVVIIAGDFLAHNISRRDALPTMVALAHRFDRVFPRAQFVIALGNEDSACGDYAVATDSAFLRGSAAAWAPLVDRHGAAPDFVRTFAHDGFYVARLPLPDRAAVVVDDTLWTPRYHPGCASRGNPTPGSFSELDRALAPLGTQRRWLVMHVPPGVDAFSTSAFVHHLAIVPFLRPGPRDAIVRLIADPSRRVDAVLTGHVHRFAFRIVDRDDGGAVPLLVSPALSPILGNLPSFLTATVTDDGVIAGIEEYSYVHRRWTHLGGLSTLGASEFSGAALRNVQHRLEHDPALRQIYSELYMGGANHSDFNDYGWRQYWCAASELGSTAYRDCLNEGGFAFLTRRGIVVVGAVAGGLTLVVVLAIVAVIARRRRARASRNAPPSASNW